MALLQDRVALVTGGGSGIGAAVAHLFAAQGATVAILDVDGPAAASTACAIARAGGTAVGIEADVRSAGRVGDAVDQVLRQTGRIDVLVNNAGIYPRRGLLEMTEAEWDEIIDINLKGAFHCARVVAPHMAARGSGKIVNISSVTFHVGMKKLAHYIASKGGVVGLTRALARELGEHNIHVNCVAPGAVETEAEARVATPDQVKAILDQQCLPRRIQPVDVARACLFLSSGLSDGITGQTLVVDGGWVMH